MRAMFASNRCLMSKCEMFHQFSCMEMSCLCDLYSKDCKKLHSGAPFPRAFYGAAPFFVFVCFSSATSAKCVSATPAQSECDWRVNRVSQKRNKKHKNRMRFLNSVVARPEVGILAIKFICRVTLLSNLCTATSS